MSVEIVVVVVIAVLALAYLAGRLITLRSGMLRAADAAANVDLSDLDLGLSDTGPTVLHFSASWCGPCAAVRRVVDQVCTQVPGVAHVEVDLDANPEAARRLSVLSLPTTIVFDAAGHPRYRASGVPTVADLRSALEPLLA